MFQDQLLLLLAYDKQSFHKQLVQSQRLKSLVYMEEQHLLILPQVNLISQSPLLYFLIHIFD